MKTTVAPTSRRPSGFRAKALRGTAALLAFAWTAGCSASPRPAAPAQSGAASSNAVSSSPTSPGVGAASGTLWILGGSTLMRWQTSAGLAALKSYFDTPNAYIVTGAKQWFIPAGWTSTPTASFTSYAGLQSALSGNTLDPRIKAVLYDNEHWSLTPAVEQSDPAHYDQLAAQLAHQHHLQFIATPAIDLVSVLKPDAPSGNGQRYQAFLDLGVVGRIAATADVIDIQAQGSEGNVALFTSFVDAAAAQARKANPAIKVIAGISTNPNGAAVTADEIDRAARAVRANVDGYWMNDPASSTACPTCTGPYPQIALPALSGL
jgi:hypothetical protein